MSSEIKIETHQAFLETLGSIGIKSIVHGANIGPCFVFATDSFFPFYFDFRTNDYTVFRGKPKSSPAPTCIDISDNKKYVITGHIDGSVSLWSVSDFTYIKSYSKALSGSPITHVKFGKSSEVIYAANANGVVSQISVSVIIAAYSFKESVVFQGEKVSNLIVSRQGHPFQLGIIVLSDSYIVFDPNTLSGLNFGQHKNPIVFKSEKFGNQPHISLMARDQDFFVNVAVGTSLNMYQIRSMYETVPLLNNLTFENENIRETLFLSSSLIAVLTESGTMQLILYNGETICKNNSKELINFINTSRAYLTYDEKMVLLSERNLIFLSFATWEEIILEMAQESQWINAFKSLSEISLNISCDLIGIPSNQSIKRRRIMDLGKKLFIDYFNQGLSGSNQDILDKLLTSTVNIITLGLIDFMNTELYKIFKEHGKLDLFYQGIKSAGNQNFVKFCTPEFVSNYVDFNNNSEECEDFLLTLNFKLSQALQLIQVAVDKKLLKLFRYFYIEYLRDCITPCQFYYENGKLLDYVEFIFKNNKENNQSIESEKDINEKSILVWLLIPDSNGDFSRFETFCSSNWEEALFYVTIFAQILNSGSINFTYKDTMTIDVLVDASLHVLHNKTYEIAEPFLTIVLPSIANKNFEFGFASLEHIVRWCFESSSKTTDREAILRSILKFHPNLIPEDTLAKLCEASNFISFIKEIYVPQKSYSKVVLAMIRNKEYRPLVFDFLKEHIEDKEQIKTAVFSSCQLLLYINPQAFTGFISDNFHDEIDQFIDLLQPSDQLIFLMTLNDLDGSIDNDKKMVTFTLMLQYRPQQAERFLSENINDLDILKAQELSIKYNRTDCQVIIKIYLHQYQEATEQIGNEIEKQLLTFIQSDSKELPTTIDELASMTDMKPCMEIINMAISLLTTISQNSKDKMTWQKTYLSFLFPLYMASKSRENIRQSVTLMFSYFVASSMNSISPHHAFLILSIHFSHLDQDIYKLILRNIISRIDYQKYLYKGLDQLLVTDCLDLIEKVYLQKTQGIEVKELNCCVCREPMDPTQYRKWNLYPCGHISHVECASEKIQGCPFCAGITNENTLISSINEKPKKLMPREVQRIIRRMNFALKRNFGESEEASESTNSAYFTKAPEFEFDENEIIELNDTLPASDDSVIVIKSSA